MLHRLGYSVRSHGNGSTVEAVDIAADVKTLLDKPAAPLLFDVGANEGQTILEMLRTFPSASIHSFEPSPRTFEQLGKQFGSRPNIKLYNLALGDEAGQMPFTVFNDWSVNDSLLKPAWSSPANSVTVSVATLDQFCEQQSIEGIDWLKIDTQGYDLRVLRGAQSLLTSGRIRLVSAEAIFNRMYDGQPSLCDLLQFMAGCNYRVNGFYEQEYISNKLSYCNVLWAHGI